MKLRKFILVFGLASLLSRGGIFPDRASSLRTINPESQNTQRQEIVIPPENEKETNITPKKHLTVQEIHAISKAVYGECYDGQTLDKVQVIQTILNRASINPQGTAYFDEDIIKVVTRKFQFTGYIEDNPVTLENYKLVKFIGDKWLESNRQKFNDIVFFRAGNPGNQYNQFYNGMNSNLEKNIKIAEGTYSAEAHEILSEYNKRGKLNFSLLTSAQRGH